MKTYLKNIPPGLAWQRLALEKKNLTFLGQTSISLKKERKKDFY